MRTAILSLASLLVAAAGGAPAPRGGIVISPQDAESAPAGALIPTGLVHSRPAPGREPRFALEAAEVDFGRLDAGATAAKSLAFRNDGKGPLKIYNIRKTCSCMVGGIFVNEKPYALGGEIAPGACGTLKINLRASWLEGEKHTKIDLLTNDPAIAPSADAPFGHAQIRVFATIDKVAELLHCDGAPLADRRVLLGDFQVAKPPEFALLARSTRSIPFEILAVVPSDPDVRIDFAPDSAPASKAAATPPSLLGSPSWRVRGALRAGLPLGKLTKRFLIVTRPPIEGLHFYCEGTGHGAVAVDPPPQSGINFGIVRPGQTAERTVSFRVLRPGAALEIRSVEFRDFADYELSQGRYRRRRPDPRPLPPESAGAIESRMHELEPGQRSEIRITIKATFPHGIFRAMLVIQTNLPDGPAEIALPVMAVLPKQ